MPGDADGLAFQNQTEDLPLATSRLASSRSVATISLTNWAKEVFGFQPSFSRALLANRKTNFKDGLGTVR